MHNIKQKAAEKIYKKSFPAAFPSVFHKIVFKLWPYVLYLCAGCCQSESNVICGL